MLDRAAVQRLVGARVVACEERAGFAANTVVVVTTDVGARLVVKRAAASEVAAELWALRAVAARGVPVPEVVAGAADADPPHLVTRFVPGVAGVSTTAVAALVGRLLRLVHSVPVHGSGFLKEHGNEHGAESGVRGPGAPLAVGTGTWADRVAELAGRLDVVADVLGPRLLGGAGTCCSAWRDGPVRLYSRTATAIRGTSSWPGHRLPR